MPHLLIRGIAPERVRAVSRPLIAELAAICECPPDHIMLECLHTTAFFDGEEAPSYPFIEVAWFDRGPEARDRFAEAVDRHVRGLGVPELEIAFRVYRQEDYYINGKNVRAENEERKQEKEWKQERDQERKREKDSAGSYPSMEALQSALRDAESENRKLKEELAKARRALLSATGGRMSSKLREALRE